MPRELLEPRNAGDLERREPAYFTSLVPGLAYLLVDRLSEILESSAIPNKHGFGSILYTGCNFFNVRDGWISVCE